MGVLSELTGENFTRETLHARRPCLVHLPEVEERAKLSPQAMGVDRRVEGVVSAIQRIRWLLLSEGKRGGDLRSHCDESEYLSHDK